MGVVGRGKGSWRFVGRGWSVDCERSTASEEMGFSNRSDGQASDDSGLWFEAHVSGEDLG